MGDEKRYETAIFALGLNRTPKARTSRAGRSSSARRTWRCPMAWRCTGERSEVERLGCGLAAARSLAGRIAPLGRRGYP